MEDICGDKAYSVVHMKKRLQTYFGSDIIITEVNGKPNIVTFRRTASSILNEFYRRPSSKSPEEKKLSMIETAAKLIKADIMSLKDSKAVYPSSVDINSEQNIIFVPDSLQTLLRALISQNDSTSEKLHLLVKLLFRLPDQEHLLHRYKLPSVYKSTITLDQDFYWTL